MPRQREIIRIKNEIALRLIEIQKLEEKLRTLNEGPRLFECVR
jgi:hypothetical protein